jgi:sodium/potassium/calcium exchanger 2
MGLPYLIYNLAFDTNITVNTRGMMCSVVILVLILVAMVSFLACFRGKLSRALGIIYIVFYVLFVLISISFTYGFVACPV